MARGRPPQQANDQFASGARQRHPRNHPPSPPSEMPAEAAASGAGAQSSSKAVRRRRRTRSRHAPGGSGPSPDDSDDSWSQVSAGQESWSMVSSHSTWTALSSLNPEAPAFAPFNSAAPSLYSESATPSMIGEDEAIGDGDEASTECTVCMRTIGPNDAAVGTQSCSHVFHGWCLRQVRRPCERGGRHVRTSVPSRHCDSVQLRATRPPPSLSCASGLQAGIAHAQTAAAPLTRQKS